MNERQAAFLESARLAAQDGCHSIACRFYERAIAAVDPLEEVRKTFGDELTAEADRIIGAESTLKNRKIKLIKALRESKNCGLADAKEILEMVAAARGRSWED